MRISECYTKIKRTKDSEVYSFTNKKFVWTVQMFTKDWTLQRKFYKDGEEVDVDRIPDRIFAAMMQSDEWELKSPIESPTSEENVVSLKESE